MGDRLEIIEDMHFFTIGWFDEENGIEGDLRLGERVSEEDDSDGFGKMHNAISAAVRDSAYDNGSYDVLRWDNKTSAKKALVIARAKMRELKSKKPPLEDWERKALEAGWKPPKGRL